MSATLDDKARQMRERRAAEEKQRQSEETAKALQLDVEMAAADPTVDRHKRYQASREHIGSFIDELLKTKE
jgi:hypothetical protein